MKYSTKQAPDQMLNKTSTGSNAQQNKHRIKCSTKQAPDQMLNKTST
jgi:hypothetical protein